eukprot:g46384.t1
MLTQVPFVIECNAVSLSCTVTSSPLHESPFQTFALVNHPSGHQVTDIPRLSESFNLPYTNKNALYLCLRVSSHFCLQASFISVSNLIPLFPLYVSSPDTSSISWAEVPAFFFNLTCKCSCFKACACGEAELTYSLSPNLL